MIAFWAFVVVFSIWMTLAVGRAFGRRIPWGDEAEVVDRTREDDPFGPDPFLRMPLLILLAAVCGRSVEDRLRQLMALVSVGTLLLTALAGWYLGGLALAASAFLLLILNPERMLLAWHLWPDGLLALWVAAITLILAHPDISGSALVLSLGVICALGALTRIDFVVVPPAVALSLMGAGDLSPAALLGLVVPTLLSSGRIGF